ncbi:hypothetical protein FNV43_RR07040 [Rhamnella rubrinervis]|uniref:Uncharacterized protein n=1 Tax=Rhamnella rubrinervis TaxID=2594499 RepID=A0A8K0MLU3_9ROSA|nr:hypothetical protein FNV43_RR07040 [Rhamnella rubrinervis]
MVVKMAKSSGRSGVLLGLPSTAEYLRTENLSDEALYEELQSSVKGWGLVESAETLVDVLRRMTDKIVTLQATLTRQENELREAARQGLENLGLGSSSSTPSA